MCGAPGTIVPATLVSRRILARADAKVWTLRLLFKVLCVSRYYGDSMKTSWLTLALLALATAMGFRSVAAANVPAHDSLSPVLVELFTSKGCSSCPPADALLTKLDGLQPIAGAQVIVLSEHVDYWNHDGWKDAYSSKLFTDRQDDYVRRFRLNSSYTPQMVVDGATQMNGSRAQSVAQAIESARSHAKIP